jgi:hypothetical protein
MSTLGQEGELSIHEEFQLLAVKIEFLAEVDVGLSFENGRVFD